MLHQVLEALDAPIPDIAHFVAVVVRSTLSLELEVEFHHVLCRRKVDEGIPDVALVLR